MEVSMIVELLIQCRAGLATSFQCFKFMALYSLIQYTSTVLMYFTFSMPADFHYFYEDLIIICTIFVTMSNTDAHTELSVEMPQDSLLGLECLASVIGQVAIQAAGQIFMIGLLVNECWYVGKTANLEYYYDEANNPDAWFPYMNAETTTIFVFSNFLYLAAIVSFTVGKPFRKPFYTNYWFTLNIVLLELYQILIAFVQDIRIPEFYFCDQDLGWTDGEFCGVISVQK